ncbi:MAG: FHA domain-containing protein [Fimbriimonadaceae bacterium]|nr:FHA domain-containing protein [Chthonomonadaceae bacterium]MCO5296761.1 FHA domain-containing protein [Fimbriimonadaceae bacterium]
MGILLLRAFVGGLAGIAAWALIEPTAPALGVGTAWSAFEVRLILTLSAAIGLAVGGLNGWLQGSRVHLLRGALVGGILGAVGGMLGYGIGGSIRDAILGGSGAVPEMGLSVTEIVARIAGITPMAACLGAAIGASSLNWRRALQGAIGGALGGALSGAVFDLIGSMLSASILAVRGQVTGEVGIASRAVMALTVGAGIGLFIGIVERISRQAWVRLRLGRNEGKEWVVDSPQVFLGRSETAQVPLFGDMTVAPMHACIMKRGTNYVLVDGGSPAGTFLNGQPIQEAILSHQAQIRIGNHHLEFLMKLGSIPQKVAEVYRGQPYPGTPSSPAPIAPQPPAAAAAPGLVAVSGPLTGQRFDVRGLVEVGREAPGITLGFDGSASRRHATFAPASGGLVVTDLNSTNGTFVNDQRVQSTTIRPGDIVKIGVTAFRVE